MDTVFLSIGSNIEPRAKYISDSIKFIQEVSAVKNISSVYETKPQGFVAETTFYNLVLELETDLKPLELLKSLQSIEQKMGRKMKSVNGVYASRVIDIDIILFGRQVIISDELIIPHPHYLYRNFVLLPLLEISEIAIDPLSQLSIKDLYSKSNHITMSMNVLGIFRLDNL